MPTSAPTGRPPDRAKDEAVREWLADLLASGPVPAGDVLHAARRAGYSRRRLDAAAGALGVKRPPGRASMWTLPGAPGGDDRCSRCGNVRAEHEFAVLKTGHRSGVCRPCVRERKNRSAHGLAHVDAVAVNRATEQAPDPGPAVTLRSRLAMLRRRGETFEDAWPVAVRMAVAGLPQSEQASWRTAFEATRGAWHRAFRRQDTAENPLFVGEPEHREHIAA